MNSNFRIVCSMLFFFLLALGSLTAQNTIEQSKLEIGITNDVALVSDKEVKLEKGISKISVWTLNDYDANPKDYTIKILTKATSGKVTIANDGISIVYVPTQHQKSEEVLIEACHVSGKCDQARISFVQSTDQNQRSNTNEQ